jgi:hypothetical protein
VRDDEHGALDILLAMWEEDALKDCCLVVHEEGKEPIELWAHRAVLSAASRPFCGMLAGGLREHGAHRLELREVAAAQLSAVLAFIYGQCVTIDTINALPLYRVADLYEVMALARECALRLACRGESLPQLPAPPCPARVTAALQVGRPTPALHLNEKLTSSLG